MTGKINPRKPIPRKPIAPQTTAGWDADPYFKTRIEYELKKKFLFDTASLLYSPFEVDTGSDLLLKTIHTKLAPCQFILELGCSYGAIGLTLAGLYPKSEVWLVDKDLLALRYTRHNAELNSLTNVKIFPSIGIHNLPAQTFDTIVSNVPAKIGDKAIEFDFLINPLQRLKLGGSYWLVVPSQLNRILPIIGRQHKLDLQEITRRNGQIVFCIKRNK